MTKTTDGITLRCQRIVSRGPWRGKQCTAAASFTVTGGFATCAMHLADTIRGLANQGQTVKVRRDL